MDELTNRQTKILKHIIEEYIETAEPVGSETLDKKFGLGISPATIRNEMGELTRLGFLTQPHTSAGRSPTPKALKFYVNNLMQPKKLSVTDEVKIKEKVWDYRTEFQKALRQATRELAQTAKALAVSADSEGDTFYAGTANILEMPEFFDIDLTRSVLSLLDRFDYLDKMFSKATTSGDTYVLLGEDLGYDYLSPCGLVFTRFGEGKKYQGVIGVLGPYRLNYQRVVPAVRYFGNLIDELEANLI
jgi:heat-inducible transcriptional repressor